MAAILEYAQGRRDRNLQMHQRFLQPAQKALNPRLEKPLGPQSKGRLSEQSEQHENVTRPNIAWSWIGERMLQPRRLAQSYDIVDVLK